jgi:hypothetical protein
MIGARAVPGSQHVQMRNGLWINRHVSPLSPPQRAGDGSRSDRLALLELGIWCFSGVWCLELGAFWFQPLPRRLDHPTSTHPSES